MIKKSKKSISNIFEQKKEIGIDQIPPINAIAKSNFNEVPVFYQSKQLYLQNKTEKFGQEDNLNEYCHLRNQKIRDKYLRRVDKSEDHLNKYTLHFYNQHFEDEWRIREICDRKIQIIMIFILKVLQDCLWQFGKGSLGNQIQQGFFDIVMFICLILMFKESFSSKSINNVKQQSDADIDEISQKIQNEITRKRAKRMYICYFLFFTIWILESVPNQYDSFAFNGYNVYDYLARFGKSMWRNIYFGTLNFSIHIVTVMMADINWIHFNMILYIFSITQFVYYYLLAPNIFTDSLIAQTLMQLAICVNNYRNIRASKINFLQDKKIKMLLKQQIQLFQNLPDGAIIYGQVLKKDEDIKKEINIIKDQESHIQIVPQEKAQLEIRFMNKTFLQMFGYCRQDQLFENKELPILLNQQQEKFQRNCKFIFKFQSILFLVKYQNKSKINNTNDKNVKFIQNLKNQESSENMSFMEQVYFQKTQYNIKKDQINKNQNQHFIPIQFIDAIKYFEDGHVYKVLVKNNEGQHISLKQLKGTPLEQKIANYLNGSYQNEDFLVYLVSQEILFDEEVSTITYFRDISFGIIQDQIKQKFNFQDFIFKTINKKIGEPLNAISINCKEIEESQNLKNFERMMIESNEPKEFRSQIKTMRVFSDLMIYRLKDMRDFQDLRLETFVKSNQKFDLQKCLKDIKEISEIKAKNKKIELIINPFEYEQDFSKIEHQFHKHMTTDQFINILPVEVLGDQDRFKQIAFNMILNSIEATYQGTITLSYQFDYTQQQIRFSITDQGVGISNDKINGIINLLRINDFAEKDQEFKQISNIEINEDLELRFGLKISNLIVSKYNGKIFFNSQVGQGSTFGFTMDMKHPDYKNQIFFLQNIIKCNGYQQCSKEQIIEKSQVLQENYRIDEKGKKEKIFSFKDSFENVDRINQHSLKTQQQKKDDFQYQDKQKDEICGGSSNINQSVSVLNKKLESTQNLNLQKEMSESILNQEETERMIHTKHKNMHQSNLDLNEINETEQQFDF